MKTPTKNDIFIVSGGAKGITAKCVVKLAQVFHSKFILFGRSIISENEPDWAVNSGHDKELKSNLFHYCKSRNETISIKEMEKKCNQIISGRQIKETLNKIKFAGSEALYISADITDCDELKQKIEQAQNQLGKISGIIHGAGIISDNLIENKTSKDFDSIYGTKIDGLINLLKCLPMEYLKFIILFSSVAGFYGNRGQTDYAMSNEILNKAAYQLKRNYPDCRILSINWGPWDSGMVSPEILKLFDEHKVQVISKETGPVLLANELNRDDNSVQIIFGGPLSVIPIKLNSDLGIYRIRRVIDLKKNPFLNDHVIGGQPVLPFTCVASWMGTTCTTFYPGYRLVCIEDMKLFKGIILNKSVQSFELEIKELEKKDQEKIVVQTTIFDERNNKIPMYQAKIGLTANDPEMNYHQKFDLKTCNADFISGEELYRSKKLFQGPSFQGVKRIINLTDTLATVECWLGDIYFENAGQFQTFVLNPFCCDVLLQVSLMWFQIFYKKPCLPISLKKLEIFRNIDFKKKFYITLQVKEVGDNYLITDMISHDETGCIFIKISDMKGINTPALNNLFQNQ